jgi:uncharacterized protein YggU (UPF0235/DUF167 family)
VDADGRLRIRVRAAPADGAANKSVIKVLAAAMHVAPSRVSLLSGARGRDKRIAVDGFSHGSAIGRWPGLLTRDE